MIMRPPGVGGEAEELVQSENEREMGNKTRLYLARAVNSSCGADVHLKGHDLQTFHSVLTTLRTSEEERRVINASLSKSALNTLAAIWYHN